MIMVPSIFRTMNLVYLPARETGRKLKVLGIVSRMI
jgi:hypothetical protein